MLSIRESIDAVELPFSRSVSDSESRKIASHGLRVTEVSEPGSVADLFNESRTVAQGWRIEKVAEHEVIFLILWGRIKGDEGYLLCQPETSENGLGRAGWGDVSDRLWSVELDTLEA